MRRLTLTLLCAILATACTTFSDERAAQLTVEAEAELEDVADNLGLRGVAVRSTPPSTWHDGGLSSANPIMYAGQVTATGSWPTGTDPESLNDVLEEAGYSWIGGCGLTTTAQATRHMLRGPNFDIFAQTSRRDDQPVHVRLTIQLPDDRTRRAPLNNGVPQC